VDLGKPAIQDQNHLNVDHQNQVCFKINDMTLDNYVYVTVMLCAGKCVSCIEDVMG
jgi:hypothetical protein